MEIDGGSHPGGDVVEDLPTLLADLDARTLLLFGLDGVLAKKRFEQTIDTVSKDTVIEAGYSAGPKEKAKGIVTSFENFIADNKDEILALQVLYSSRPDPRR